MPDDWVEVYKSLPSQGLAAGLKRLRKAGIPYRVIQGSPNTRWLRRHLQDMDSFYVPSESAVQARTILKEWEEESGERVEEHLKGLHGELAVAIALIAFVVCVAFSVYNLIPGALVSGVVCLLVLPSAWRRLKKNKPVVSQDKDGRRWF